MIKLDRYDWVITLLMGLLMDGAVALGALWAVVLIMFVGCTAVFVRHIDEFRVK